MVFNSIPPSAEIFQTSRLPDFSVSHRLLISPSMAEIARQVSGFIALPIQLISPSSASSVTHYLYLRPDQPKLPTAESAHSLFLVNIPFNTTEQHLKHLFAVQLSAGRVKHVDFSHSTTPSSHPTSDTALLASSNTSKKRKRITSSELELQLQHATLPDTWDRAIHPSGSHAVVVFVDKPSMEASLKAAKKAVKLATTITWGKGIENRIPPLGLKRYEAHHALCYPSRNELLSSVDSYMSAYARMEEAHSREEAKKRQQPDGDGFITVTKGARGGVVRKEDAKQLGEKQREKDRNKDKGMGNFYRFQMREVRKEQQGELIRKFDDDKRRLDEMRKRRGKIVVSHGSA
jgi:Rrp7 RRM-like N-terminal domain/Ribosomal RNA-processing protein 7 (RRP7) C-terminal domain